MSGKKQKHYSDSESEEHSEEEQLEEHKGTIKKELGFVPPLEPQIYCLIGEPKSGKSTLIKSLLYYYAQAGYMKWVTVISGSLFNSDFDFIENKKCLWDGYDEERFRKYFETLQHRANELKKEGKKLPKSILILDDLLGELASNADFFKSVIVRFRHFGVTVIIASQYCADARACSTVLRSCTNIACLWPSIQHNQIESMWRSFGGYYKKLNDFSDVLKEIKKDKYACLLYQKEKDTPEEAYIKFRATPAPADFTLKF